MPSLREKKRYLAYEIISKEKLTKESSVREINKNIKKFIGTLGMARAGVMPVDFKGNKGIIKMNNKYVDEVRAGLMMVKKIDDKDVIIRSLKISGILDKVKGEI